MKHDYVINADVKIGKEGTDNILKLNGIDVTHHLKGYTGSDSINIDADNEISVADSGITINKLAQDVLNFLIPTGTIVPYVGNEAPDGWMICDGSPLHNTAETRNLYDILVHNSNFWRRVHGHSDEKRVYLPDLRDRFIKGVSSDATKIIGDIETSALPNIYASFVTFYNPDHGQDFKGAIATSGGPLGQTQISRSRKYLWRYF